MIYIILGTRGQFMKMFPLMKLLDKEKIEYKFIYTGQHPNVMETVRVLGIRKPDIILAYRKKDMVNIGQVMAWASIVLFNARKLPIKKDDYILIHGNAETSFLSLLIAKFFRAKAVRVEAGTRSGNFLSPFPEEIINAVLDKFSDIYFCPYPENAATIKRKNYVYTVNGNTGFDSVQFALLEQPSGIVRKIIKKTYVVFTLRRMETVCSVSNLTKAINILEEILKRGYVVIWPIHQFTAYWLKKKNLWEKIISLKNSYKLETENIFNYVDYVHILKHSSFIASDGGGPQNEAYFLDKPFLNLRSSVVNEPGTNENAFPSELDLQKSLYFLDHYKEFKRKTSIKGSPSQFIVNFFKKKVSLKSFLF